MVDRGAVGESEGSGAKQKAIYRTGGTMVFAQWLRPWSGPLAIPRPKRCFRVL